jgi:hypothetical protein
MGNGNGKSRNLTDELKLKIKEEFIQGFLDEQEVRRYPTLDALIKRHGVARTTLYRHASKENWQRQKNEFLTALEREGHAARLSEMLAQSKRLDGNALQLAHSLMGKVARQLQKDEERHKEDVGYRGLSAIILERLSIVVGNAQRIGKLALGEAQEISKINADVSAPDSFTEIMEQLDELREHRASEGNYTLQ